MSNPSPLRYPGGKYKISPLIRKIIKKSDLNNFVYIEPFAGGAGIALDLLFSNDASEIIINDYDKAISSFWKAIIKEPNHFIDKILTIPLTIDEWYNQKMIYGCSKSYSFEYGFSTFYLNRTNHSGILSSGPIGGFEQKISPWSLGVRFNREKLAEKVKKIADEKKRIHCYNQEILSFLRNILPRYSHNSFIYFDPPYFVKGKRLYKNFLNPKDHENIANEIFKINKSDWIVSYDSVPEIENIYRCYCQRKFSLSYSLANKGSGTEVMIFKDEALCPSLKELREDNIKITLWE